MKKVIIIVIVLIISFLLSLTLLCRAQSPAYMTELIAKAKELAADLEKGDYEAAVKNFDAVMQKAAPPEKMKQVWEAVKKQLGELKEQKSVRTESGPRYDVVYITLEFEKSTLDMKVVFNKDKMIAGQFFTQPPAPYDPPEYADPDSFMEKEAEFGVEGWKLPGTLTVPKGDGPFPAVVLVHGSGPNDRDETVGANKPFKDLAWGLASNGIAALRYDKRTKTYAEKMLAKKDTALTVYEETVQDAAEAAEFLQNQDKIDPKSIFILGHSLGGTLIPRIADETDLAAGFIIMAGAARPLEDLFAEQTKYILTLDGELTPKEKEKLEETKKEVEKIKNLTSGKLGENKRILGAYPGYWFDLKGYQPANSAQRIQRPLLILQGGRDYQVTEEDFALWKKSLSSNDNVTFKLYPSLNHLFISGEGLSTPQEYQQPGHVSSRVIRDITSWVRGLAAESN